MVGPVNDGRHSILVAWRDNGEEGKGSKRQVVYAAGHTALIIAVGVETGGGDGRRTGRKSLKRNRWMKSKKEDFIIISYLKRFFYHFVKHQHNGFFNVENSFFC